MGYRSTVAYTIRFIPQVEPKEAGIDLEEAKGAFFTFLAEAKSKVETAGAFKDEHLTVDEENLAIYFHADEVKWYETFEDVKCHECLMGLSREWAEDGDCSSPYIGGAFARIGEDPQDTVEEAWGQGEYDWISVHRYMQCDWMD